MSRFEKDVESSSLEMGDDDDFIFYFQKGNVALKRGALEEARSALERAVQLKPDQARARSQLGMTYFRLGLLEPARHTYEKLVEEHPREPPLLVNLGLVLLRQGRLVEAEKVLRTALSIVPEHPRANAYLGMVLHRQGDTSKAKEHLRKGGAEQLAQKLDRKSVEPRPSEMLRAVVDEGIESIEHDPESLRPVLAGTDERSVRDESAWVSRAPHTAADEVFAPRDEDPDSTWSNEITGAVAVRLTAPHAHPAPARSAQSPQLTAWSTPPAVKPTPFPVVEPGSRLAHTTVWEEGFSLHDAEGLALVRLRLNGHAHVRAAAIAWALGSIDLSASPFVELLRAAGDARVLIRCPNRALLVRLDGRARVRRSAIVAAASGLRPAADSSSSDLVAVEGQGTLVLDVTHPPLSLEVSPRAPLWIDEASILAHSADLEASPALLGPRTGWRLNGSGWVLVDGSAVSR